MKDNLQFWQQTSYLAGGNIAYIEDLYELYLKDPQALTADWQEYFQGLDGKAISHSDIKDYFIRLGQTKNTKVLQVVKADNRLFAAQNLVAGYRRYGHMAANINPLNSHKPKIKELSLSFYGLTTEDLNSMVTTDFNQGQAVTLEKLLKDLPKVYCNTIGFEYDHITDSEELAWLRTQIETNKVHDFSPVAKKDILQLLIAADGLEKYLGNKYVGQKRFSLEGGDSLMPMLRQILVDGGAKGLKAAVIGMAHRGRLNVLLNILGKPPRQLYQEFTGQKGDSKTSGDVKYHLGFAADIKIPSGSIYTSLAFNPSHLEIIAPVVTGEVRAKQDWYQDTNRELVLPIILHGDAAFSGQGVVMETLNMSQTRAYGVGGSLHIVINNQVGFTASDPQDTRSSYYCTDIAKMINAPIFHVNGDDPEATVLAAQLALNYRLRFHKDVVIDLVCYRRHGHNEADEPSATQPSMYQIIRHHPTPLDIYGEQLIKDGILDMQAIADLKEQYRLRLEKGDSLVATIDDSDAKRQRALWQPFLNASFEEDIATSFNKEKLIELAKQLAKLPEGFELQRQVGLMMAARSKMTAGELPLDWGYAENLAYATLVNQGYRVRISGQDSGRGTFAHRHAKLYEQKTNSCYVPLQNLATATAKFEIYDSLLSEVGALGFEYGYASCEPNTLVIWEAQFGDFSNGAQVVIDQFISSSWEKWQRLAGVVLFLPHGYEGMGPEHSSARLERFLQLCAQGNMQVCAPTTPAQIFHLLRRQVFSDYRIPLVVMTPKSLLRHKLAVSSLNDLATGKFQLVMPEVDDIVPSQVKRVVLCSGKVYYDLLASRRENQYKDVAIIRIEQLYPFPYSQVQAMLRLYSNAKEIIWCQEEPQNQGAFRASQHRLMRCLQEGQTLTYAGRIANASPAVGSSVLHAEQQLALIKAALHG